MVKSNQVAPELSLPRGSLTKANTEARRGSLQHSSYVKSTKEIARVTENEHGDIKHTSIEDFPKRTLVEALLLGTPELQNLDTHKHDGSHAL